MYVDHDKQLPIPEIDGTWDRSQQATSTHNMATSTFFRYLRGVPATIDVRIADARHDFEPVWLQPILPMMSIALGCI